MNENNAIAKSQISEDRLRNHVVSLESYVQAQGRVLEPRSLSPMVCGHAHIHIRTQRQFTFQSCTVQVTVHQRLDMSEIPWHNYCIWVVFLKLKTFFLKGIHLQHTLQCNDCRLSYVLMFHDICLCL